MLWRGPMGGGAASGKIGAMIASHCAQGQYLKHRVKCVNPRTELQHPMRNALRSLASMWGSTLTPTQRASWATYAANVTWVNRLGDTVHLSGQMEFCRSNWPRFQIGLPMVLDAPVIFDRGSTGGGTLTIGVGNDFGVLSITPAPPWQDGSTLTACMVYMGLPRSAARTFMAPRTQLSAVLLGNFGALTAFPPLQPRGNIAQYNQAYPAWLVATFSDGRLTTPTPITPVFTGSPPLPGWTETFPYPNGNLVGNADWALGFGGVPSPVVTSNTISPTAGTETGAFTHDPLLPASMTAPWTVTITLATVPGAGTDDIQFQVFMGDDPASPGTASFMLLEFAPGDMNLGLLSQLRITDQNGNDNTVTAVPFTANTNHVIAWQFTGAAFNVTIDGVTVFSFPAAPQPATIAIGVDLQDFDGTDSLILSRIHTEPPA